MVRGGTRHPGKAVRALPQVTAHRDNSLVQVQRWQSRHGMRTRGPIRQPGDALGPEPVYPAVRALTRYPELFGDVLDRTILHQHPLDKQSTAPDI